MPDTYTPNLNLKKPGYDSPADIKDLNDNFDKIDAHANQLSQQMTDYWKTVYPIGSIYMSTDNTSPASLFGGTWEQIKDRFLLGAGGNYVLGNIGGEAEVALTDPAQNAPHIHDLSSNVYASSTGGNGIGFYYPTTGSTDWGTPKALSSGEGKPHNNMPPWQAVNMWRRMA